MISPLGLGAVIVLCLALSFFLSGVEAGLFALSRLRIRRQMHAGNASARLLHGYLEHPEDFLWTILIGNALANFAAVGLLVYGLHVWLGHRPVWFTVAFVPLVFALYAFGDLLPKMLFRQSPNRYCLRAAGPFRIVHALLSPLVSLIRWLAGQLLRWTGGKRFTGRLFGNREELRLLMQESAQSLSSEERGMINRVLDLQKLNVGELMRPLEQVVTVTAQTPLAEVLALCREKALSRLPVRERDGGRIAGYLALQTALYQPGLDPRQPAGQFLHPAIYLEPSLRLELALQRLRRGGQRLAIVLAPDGRELGILTLEDILRFIFGEVSLA
jgi:CBS domain containing-hemolysin-like protein